MTTIAYRSGMIAADTGVSSGGARVAHVQKVWLTDCGALVGWCGDAPRGEAFCEWAKSDREEPPPLPERNEDGDDGKGLIVWPGGQIELFEATGRLKIAAPYYAMGSGRDFALGAMAYGAEASDAVRAAMEHDSDTHGEVTVLRA